MLVPCFILFSHHFPPTWNASRAPPLIVPTGSEALQPAAPAPKAPKLGDGGAKRRAPSSGVATAATSFSSLGRRSLLVGGFNPSEKYYFVSWEEYKRFETTNQTVARWMDGWIDLWLKFWVVLNSMLHSWYVLQFWLLNSPKCLWVSCSSSHRSDGCHASCCEGRAGLLLGLANEQIGKNNN